MNLGVDINSLGYKVAPDRFYIYSDGHTLDSFRNKEMTKTVRHGYICVALYNPIAKRVRQEYLHRIISKAFVPNPKGLPCVNHKDGVKTNNSLANLEWCSFSDNIEHAYKKGLRKNGHGGEKNTPIVCLDTGKTYRSISSAAKETGVRPSGISNCLAGRTKTCGKKHWGYLYNL